MLLHAGLLAVGLVVVVLGAELLVRGASRLALALGLTPLVIGLTVVAFGTSAPELVTSVVAIRADSPGIALGNIIGSNIANLALILAIAAMIRPLPVDSAVIRRDLPLLAGVTLLTVLLLGFRLFGLAAGVGFVGLLIWFTAWQVRTSRQELPAVAAEFEEEITSLNQPLSRTPLIAAVGLSLLGLGLLIGGGRLLVDAAIALAATLGVPDRIVGLTIVAVGTSLPELATTLVAVLRNEPDVAVGNVVGSNIFNLLFIGGIVAMLHGAPLVLPTASLVDGWVMVAVTTVAAGLLFTGRALSRAEGGVLLAGYVTYLVWLIR